MDATDIRIESNADYMGAKALFIRCNVKTLRGHSDEYAYRGTVADGAVYVTAWGGGAEDGRHVGYVSRESYAGRFPVQVANTLRGLLQ